MCKTRLDYFGVSSVVNLANGWWHEGTACATDFVFPKGSYCHLELAESAWEFALCLGNLQLAVSRLIALFG